MHEVKVETGEESEDTFWKCRSKLYRWAAGGEWKERGLGEAKLLQHRETKKIRFLLRQEKTLKIVANHYGEESMLAAFAAALFAFFLWTFALSASVKLASGCILLLMHLLICLQIVNLIPLLTSVAHTC